MSFLIEKQYFSPEFLNRFDGVIAFAPLSSETAFVIGRKMVQELALNIQNLHNVTITVSDETLKQIITKHFNPAYGARDLQRAIQEQVENIIAQKILSGEAGKGSAIEI
jgi:ATP-dependent Clp protease ATP-binding subunit ClpA